MRIFSLRKVYPHIITSATHRSHVEHQRCHTQMKNIPQTWFLRSPMEFSTLNVFTEHEWSKSLKLSTYVTKTNIQK